MGVGRGESRWARTDALRATVVALAAGLVLGAGCGGDDDGRPTAEDVPPGAVAVVGEREISERELRQEVASLRRAGSNGDDPATGQALERQALQGLIEAEWLAQEAARRGIEVSLRDVRRRWREATQAQFESRRAMQRFFGGETRAYVVRQLWRQEVVDRILAQARQQAGDPEQAVAELQAELRRSGLDSTACGEGYRAPGCAR